MNLLFDALSWIAILGGSAFALVGGLGIIRLPDFYARLHGGGIADTLGAGLIMCGLMLQAVKVGLAGLVGGDGELGPWLVALKLGMILFFLLITSPTGCHALAQAALSQGLRPVVRKKGESAE